jgi:potassium-transporting ATPase potassium-binding subunit
MIGAMGFFWTIVTLVVALGLTRRYLGSYMTAVFDGPCRISPRSALTVQQFVTPAVGIPAGIALVRGFSRRNSPRIGNWVDMTRCLMYILAPIAFVAGIIFVAEGGVQTLAGPATAHNVLNGVTQTIARGPIALKVIRQLGTNGGGFLNTNSATTFENPTGVTNWLSMYLLLCVPFALTYTFGKMVGSVRHGAALLGAMVLIFGTWVGYTAYAEHQPNPAVQAAGVVQTTGNMEGTEVRFGDTSSALFGVASTNTSTGSANSAYDSYNPIDSNPTKLTDVVEIGKQLLITRGSLTTFLDRGQRG